MKKIGFIVQFLIITSGILAVAILVGQYIGNLLAEKDTPPPSYSLPKRYLPLTAVLPQKTEDKKKSQEEDILEVKLFPPPPAKVSEKPATDVKDIQKPDEVFKLQIGAFSFQDGAERVKDELKKQGYQAEVIQKQKGDATFFVVYVGKFKTRDEAEKAKTSLLELGYEPFITK